MSSHTSSGSLLFQLPLTEHTSPWHPWSSFSLMFLPIVSYVSKPSLEPQSPSVQFSSVQSLSCVRLFATPWIAAHQASLSITNSRSSPKPTSIESVMPSSILCRPLLLLPPIPPSIRVFSNESTLHMRWPKYWSFSFSISPSKGIPGLISFRMDWLDLLAVQGTLKSLLQHYSWKASILWCSAFFTVQLSHPHVTTGKTIALTRRNFVGKVMSLLLNMLPRLVITLPWPASFVATTVINEHLTYYLFAHWLLHVSSFCKSRNSMFVLTSVILRAYNGSQSVFVKWTNYDDGFVCLWNFFSPLSFGH